MAALGEWLRAFNHGRAPGERVGIHGIDLYAVWESLDAVQDFYRARLPRLAGWVEHQYRGLRGFRGRYREYARYARRSGRSLRPGVAAVKRDLAMRDRESHPAERGRLFEALQHARVVDAGVAYLEAPAGPEGWNTRARHFDRAVTRQLAHYGPGSRGVVWAHNTHIGDARATDMVRTGEVNLGQLSRERHGAGRIYAVGFGTATGTVVAAGFWEGPGRVMTVPPPRPDSLEAALVARARDDRILLLDRVPAGGLLHRVMLPHRAIGVVFEPGCERERNYVPTRLAGRYDAFVFIPRTRALAPLHERRQERGARIEERGLADLDSE